MTGRRSLTSGEIDLAYSIFGSAIDYGSVKLIRGKWWPFQPRGVVMAPTGNIHFHPHSKLWSEDFSGEPLTLQGLFIHEMTHVWQAQTRGRFYLVLMRHPFCRYTYELVDDRPFDRYGLEQQAEIVRHRFLADRGAVVSRLPDRNLLPFNETVTVSQQT
ncbi:MAG TPA: vgr related protein [Sphingomicrobium sp.]|nr:vgr related protein [Sphingomicrobium sp.]